MLLNVKQLNGYIHFGGNFNPQKLLWARKKNVSLNFSSTTTYVRTKKIGVGHLPNVILYNQAPKI